VTPAFAATVRELRHGNVTYAAGSRRRRQTLWQKKPDRIERTQAQLLHEQALERAMLPRRLASIALGQVGPGSMHAGAFAHRLRFDPRQTSSEAAGCRHAVAERLQRMQA